jgi:hypothetical protein
MLLLLLRSKLNGTHVFFARKMFEKLATTFLKRGERETEREREREREQVNKKLNQLNSFGWNSWEVLLLSILLLY